MFASLWSYLHTEIKLHLQILLNVARYCKCEKQMQIEDNFTLEVNGIKNAHLL